MRKNPFLKAHKIVIKRVYNNAATLNLNVVFREYDASTGGFVETEAVYPRTIHISNPHQIADIIVDKTQYLKGDLNADVAFLEVAESIKPMTGDPTVTISGVAKTINDFRAADHRTGGIDETKDTLLFDGTTYRIVRITPKSFYAGTPAVLKIQLRAV